MHYLMFYDYTDDYLARRSEFRDEHLRLAWASHERGELILGGAYTEPADGAMLLFKCDSPLVAEKFAKADPYLKNGLVRQWRVRLWNTVVGHDAATPLRLE